MSTARVLVVTTDPVGDTMPGPAIRAWHLSAVLAAHQRVTLASTVSAQRSHPDFAVVDASDAVVRRSLASEADVVVIPSGVFYQWPELGDSDRILVVDLYDPYHLENLEAGDEGATDVDRDGRVGAMTDAISEHLRRGDFFLCATERQRDFWLGSLASVGRVNPYTYDVDPTLASLVAVVPFGIPVERPQRRGAGLRGSIPGVGEADPVILWAGGVYNWFDPVSLVRAMPQVAASRPDARLVFLGMRHPNPAIPAMRAAVEARAETDRLGLTDRSVFFNEGWVPYDERASYLLDATVGVSTHLDHIETRYSFRTRVLDYLWVGLPMVLTGGDVLAEVVAEHGLGRVVPPGDVAALGSALVAALGADPIDQARFDPVRRPLEWDRVAAPLLAFCAAPRRAPDLVARPADAGRQASGPAGEAGGYTPAMPSLRAKAVATRDRLVVPIAHQTADRLVQSFLAEMAELERILGDQDRAAGEVAETLGRMVTRLTAEVTTLAGYVGTLTAEVARLNGQLDRAESALDT